MTTPTVLDVCSVKSYPKLIWSELLSDTTGLVLSHPMFGPASYAMNKYSTAGFTITLENISASTKHYAYLTDVFSNALSLNVVEMSAEEHDKKAAIFHGTAQYLANLLRRLEIETSAIDTYSYRKLIAFRDAISTDERFLSELMEYNPFLPEIIADIHSTEDALYKSLTDRSEE